MSQFRNFVISAKNFVFPPFSEVESFSLFCTLILIFISNAANIINGFFSMFADHYPIEPVTTVFEFIFSVLGIGLYLFSIWYQVSSRDPLPLGLKRYLATIQYPVLVICTIIAVLPYVITRVFPWYSLTFIVNVYVFSRSFLTFFFILFKPDLGSQVEDFQADGLEFGLMVVTSICSYIIYKSLFWPVLIVQIYFFTSHAVYVLRLFRKRDLLESEY
jgi:hypothetical protein